METTIGYDVYQNDQGASFVVMSTNDTQYVGMRREQHVAKAFGEILEAKDIHTELAAQRSWVSMMTDRKISVPAPFNRGWNDPNAALALTSALHVDGFETKINGNASDIGVAFRATIQVAYSEDAVPETITIPSPVNVAYNLVRSVRHTFNN